MGERYALFILFTGCHGNDYPNNLQCLTIESNHRRGYECSITQRVMKFAKFSI